MFLQEQNDPPSRGVHLTAGQGTLRSTVLCLGIHRLWGWLISSPWSIDTRCLPSMNSALTKPSLFGMCWMQVMKSQFLWSDEFLYSPRIMSPEEVATQLEGPMAGVILSCFLIYPHHPSPKVVPTCQVRVSRFYHASSPLLLLILNRKLQISVRTAGPQPRALSGHCPLRFGAGGWGPAVPMSERMPE